MPFDKNLVAKRLKEARLRSKISQKKLGISAGIDEFSASARMNQYETAKHVPDLLTLKQIAKVLKVPIAFFYAEDDTMARLITCFNDLKTSDKEKILKAIEGIRKKSNLSKF